MCHHYARYIQNHLVQVYWNSYSGKLEKWTGRLWVWATKKRLDVLGIIFWRMKDKRNISQGERFCCKKSMILITIIQLKHWLKDIYLLEIPLLPVCVLFLGFMTLGLCFCVVWFCKKNRQLLHNCDWNLTATI